MAEQHTSVYIVAHKDFEVPDLPGYEPILAGADNNHASIAVKDNTGINISSKNPEYCELTAQYWVWKNALDTADNFGFVHYRRYFYTSRRKTQIVPAEQFSNDLEHYDVILPEPWILSKKIGVQFAQFHNVDDLHTVREILTEQCPEYAPAFDALMDGHSMSAYNMFVMPRKLFNNYITWLFGILEEAEKRIDISEYDAYNRRLFGFLAERLLNVWVMTRKLRVKHYPVYMPTDNWLKESLRTEVKSILFEHRF